MILKIKLIIKKIYNLVNPKMSLQEAEKILFLPENYNIDEII
jgi:hypothetical protein